MTSWKWLEGVENELRDTNGLLQPESRAIIYMVVEMISLLFLVG